MTPQLPDSIDDVPDELFSPDPYQYRNYRDANPRLYGGTWLAWDPERRAFPYVRTVPAADINPDIDDTDAQLQYVETGEIDLDEIFEGGSPRSGFCRGARRTASALDIGAPGEILERLRWFVGAYIGLANEGLGRFPHDLSEYDGGYWGFLGSFGVGPGVIAEERHAEAAREALDATGEFDE